MIEKHIEEKLGLFNQEKYKIVRAGESIVLKEKSQSGKVVLNCTVKSDAIIITTPEKNVLRYLDESIKGATSCADIFIFRKNEEDSWELHIIEFKKTIDTSTVAKSKNQLTMGIYNARAIAAFLGFEIRKIFLYSGFRKDSIKDLNATALSAIRANVANYNIVKLWKSDKWKLMIDDEEKELEHSKIQLDATGAGSCVI